jgi:hypothetical protein
LGSARASRAVFDALVDRELKTALRTRGFTYFFEP